MGETQVDPAVSLRDVKQERVNVAIENRNAVAEAAAGISPALAPQNEEAHAERERAVHSGLVAIADLFGGDEEYVGQAVIEAVCNRSDYLHAAKHSQLHQALGELAGLMRRFSGGEIDDQRIIRKQEWIAKCEAQKDGALDVLKGAMAAYRDLTDNTWYPRQSDPQAKARSLRTKAAHDAHALLQRHNMA